jgi:ATP cone domain
MFHNASDLAIRNDDNEIDISLAAQMLSSKNTTSRQEEEMIAEPPNAAFLVTKRNGSRVPFDATKLCQRMKLCLLSDENYNAAAAADNAASSIDMALLTATIERGLYDGVSTDEVDVLAAETAASMATQHPAYGTLAAQI